MDCFVPQDPYNMERVFWLLSNKDGALVKKMMEEFQLTHAHTLPDNLRKQVTVHCVGLCRFVVIQVILSRVVKSRATEHVFQRRRWEVKRLRKNQSSCSWGQDFGCPLRVNLGFWCSVRSLFTTPVSANLLKCSAVWGFIIWKRLRWRDHEDHEKMLGGEQIPVVSSLCRGGVASLQLSTQPCTQQVQPPTHYSDCIEET